MDFLANMSNDQLIAGSTDEKINRMLLLLRDGFKDMKSQLAAANSRITALEGENAKLKGEHAKLVDRINNLENKQDNEQVLSEYHNKKYNMIIHKLEEPNDAWESNIESIDKVYKFFKEDLGIDDAYNMQFVNAHRMGVRKTILDPTTNKSLHTRPLIVRFTCMPDKERVQKHLGALKTYNRNIQYKYHRVFVTDQLPKRMDDQRKKLVDKFISARKRKAKAKWSVDKHGNYCLYVDKVQVFANAD